MQYIEYLCCKLQCYCSLFAGVKKWSWRCQVLSVSGRSLLGSITLCCIRHQNICTGIIGQFRHNMQNTVLIIKLLAVGKLKLFHCILTLSIRLCINVLEGEVKMEWSKVFMLSRLFSTGLASDRPADIIQDHGAGQQMSVGPSTPISRWALPAGRSSHWMLTPEVGRLWQTRRATDSHSHWSQELCSFRSWDMEQFTSSTVCLCLSTHPWPPLHDSATLHQH